MITLGAPALLPQRALAQSADLVALEVVAAGLSQVVAVTHAGDGSGRLFIVEQGGTILVDDGSAVLSTPFLDLRARVSCCGERGLLDVAFHPDYALNGRFFVHYTDASGDSVIAGYRVSAADPNVADAASGATLLTVAQPFGNHNGGEMAFGRDGYLYIGIGDGGSAGDPGNRAQDPGLLLGKILRLDVDGAAPYAIPPDNPFVGVAGARPEIWALGLRNPWRFSFDRITGDLFIGDVGQNSIEEIDFQPASSPGGENYGWRRMEGSECFDPPVGCDDGTLTLPVIEYRHVLGNCSVTGGYRYRGARFPQLAGVYLYGDYCSGRIWGARADASGNWAAAELMNAPFSLSAFGEDERGELYVASYDVGNSTVYRIAPTFPVCRLEAGQAAYVDGETVTLSTFTLANPWSAALATELKIWIEIPGLDPTALVNAGASGELVLPPGYSVELGPRDLFPVVPELPRGPYQIGCRMLHPVTGAEMRLDRDSFELR